jgi:hypothetical protein
MQYVCENTPNISSFKCIRGEVKSKAPLKKIFNSVADYCADYCYNLNNLNKFIFPMKRGRGRGGSGGG